MHNMALSVSSERVEHASKGLKHAPPRSTQSRYHGTHPPTHVTAFVPVPRPLAECSGARAPARNLFG